MSLTAEAITNLVTQITKNVANHLEQRVSEQIRQVQANFDALSLNVSPPTVLRYEDIEIDTNIQCDIGLDVVKTVPEFSGESVRYPSW